MQQYTDMNGQIHSVKITVHHRFQIKAKTGIDLLAAVGDPAKIVELFDKISNDDFFVISCLAIIEGQTEEALMSVADGAVLEAASTAFVEALLNFFPPSNPMVKPLRVYVNRNTTLIKQVYGTIGAGMLQVAETMDLLTVASSSATQTNGSGALPEPSGTESPMSSSCPSEN